MIRTLRAGRDRAGLGQALVLFALFLLVLIGAAALAIDYANWQLTDRQLQNVADHAALAGAGQFPSDFSASSCTGATCVNARSQSWASLSHELNLGLDATAIATLASRDSPAAGDTSATLSGGAVVTFSRHIWVSTPPPLHSGGHNEYNEVGGLYAGSYGIVFARIDQPTRSFLAGVFGFAVRDRTGWATAGILPTDFALSVYCRNNIAPESGVCADGGTSLGIDGGGGITLAHGDIGSSNSLQVTQQTGSGTIVKAGNVFLVNGTCGPSNWNCPPATLGGISDGSGTAKNAFYIPPLSVPSYALPTGTGSLPWSDSFSPNSDCTTASVASPCIPIPATSNYSTNGIDWACAIGSGTNACGTPVVTTTSGVSTVTCTSNGAATQDLRPNGDESSAPTSGSTGWGSQGGSGGSIMYNRINDTSIDPTGTTVPNPPAGPTTLAGTPSSFVYTKDGTTAGTYRVTLSSPNGTPQTPGFVYLRWTLFGVQKSGGSEVVSDPGGAVTVTAQLQEKVGGTWVNRGLSDTHTATGSVVEYQTTAVADVSTIVNPNALGILFTVSDPTAANFGAGISWAEAWLDQAPVPPPPPTIAPGQYRSIVIPDNGCAVLDPTGYESGGLAAFQMPGIFYFRDSSGGGQNATISLGNNAALIGDGVTLVFASNWPNPSGSGGSASAHGIELGTNSALVINAAISNTSDAACPQGVATTTYNPSTPLPGLTHNAVCAAWEIDPANTTTGVSPWGGPCSTACSINRSTGYATAVNTTYRGVSFYFIPKTNGSTNSSAFSVLGRFAMGGNVAGIAFRGILYAPYDDVQMSGANGFDTVGMVLAWSAKFNGGSAAITLDYPYTRIAAAPYLLEPSVSQ